LSSLASLAEFPARVKRIFITKETNKAGCYAVSLYINGEMKTVVVDDRFPYNEDRQNWAFSRPSKSSEIWVLILEKAWAKIFGSYQRIEGG
jgi:calpain-15